MKIKRYILTINTKTRCWYLTDSYTATYKCGFGKTAFNIKVKRPPKIY